MKNRLKQNVPLIIGLAIPILMIIFVAGAVYLPHLFSTVEPPKHDFLYMVGRGYGDVHYRVRDGRLVRKKIKRANPTPRSYTAGSEIRFFVYHVRAHESEAITFEKAAKLKLDSKVRSPDGYSIVRGRRPIAFFPFWASWDYKTRYLKKDSYTEKLSLETGEEYPFYYSFRFLGWVVE